jgi:hypothetical protein
MFSQSLYIGLVAQSNGRRAEGRSASKEQISQD